MPFLPPLCQASSGQCKKKKTAPSKVCIANPYHAKEINPQPPRKQLKLDEILYVHDHSATLKSQKCSKPVQNPTTCATIHFYFAQNHSVQTLKAQKNSLDLTQYTTYKKHYLNTT